MTVQEQLIKEHNFYKYADEMRGICEPLLFNTPINYFFIGRIYKNRKYSGFMTDKQWAHFYLKHDFTQLGVEHLLRYRKDNCCFWSAEDVKPNSQKAKLLLQGAIEHQHASGVSIVNTFHNYIELCLISTNYDPYNIDPYLIENVPLLKNMILYINEKIYRNPKLYKAFLNKYSNSLVKDSFSIVNKTTIGYSIQKYYFGGELGNIAFTKREAECLKYIYHNKTAKQIAQALQLSPRTIETYIEKIKTKTHCGSLQTLRLKLEGCTLLEGVL